MNSSRVFRNSAAASTLLLILAACREPQRALGPGTLSLRSATPGTVAECASTSWMSASGYIGPDGGLLSVPGASVSFPEGALDSWRSISFSVGPAGPDSTGVVLSSRSLGPTTLSAPVTITLNFASCAVIQEEAPADGISFTETTDGLSDSTVVITEETPLTAQEVILSVQSFSWYIIAH